MAVWDGEIERSTFDGGGDEGHRAFQGSFRVDRFVFGVQSIDEFRCVFVPIANAGFLMKANFGSIQNHSEGTSTI